MDDSTRRAAFDLILAYHREYGTYHGRKETMAWLVATVGVGAAAAVFIREPFWVHWKPLTFLGFFIVAMVTAGSFIALLRFQNVNRHRGAAMFEAAANTYAQWLKHGIADGDLEPTTRFDYERHKVPAAIATRYRKLMARESVWEIFGYAIVGAWGIAALLHIFCTWARCR